MEKDTITIWNDGTWKLWRALDATYAANDPDWLVNISLKTLESSK